MVDAGLHYSEKYGRDFTLKELSEISGINRDTIKRRIYRGYSVDEAAEFVPFPGLIMNKPHYSEKYGREFTMKELSELSGIDEFTIKRRMQRGYSVDEAAEFVPFPGLIMNKPHYSEKYGREFTMKELSELSGVNKSTIKMRKQRGYSVDEAAEFVPYLSKYKHAQRCNYKTQIGELLVLSLAYSDDSTDYYECINTESNETFIKSKEELYELWDINKEVY